MGSDAHDRGVGDDRSKALDALRRLSPQHADDRATWIKVGMALHSVDPNLFSEWDEWSRSSEKYKEGECETQWRSFKRDKSRSVGVGTLIKLAREDCPIGHVSSSRHADHTQTYATLADAIAAVVRRTKGTVNGTWEYVNADGKPSFTVVRVDHDELDRHGKVHKTFRPIRRARAGFELGDPAGKLPLYRLPALAAAKLVVVVEGEKAADMGAAIGLVTTTSAHGSKCAHKSDWTPLAGRNVVVLPDNDEAGEQYLQSVVSILRSLTPPATVQIVKLPGIPAGGDLVEFVRDHRSADRTDTEIGALIDGFVQASPPFDGFDGSRPPPFDAFSEPRALPDERPSVAPFDFKFVPETLRDWIQDITERMQCPPDFVFVTTVVVMASLIGRKVGIRPKRFDSWTVIVNLWGALVGPPSSMKTPAMKEGMAPLCQLQREAQERFKADKTAFDIRVELSEARRDARRKKLRTRLESEADDDGLAALIAGDVPVEPVLKRYIVNDSTVEKLGEILNQNSNGVLNSRDEVSGLLRSLDKEGQESARAFYLQAWNGDSSYTYDRVGRGTLHIESAIVSVLGTIQPGPFGQYLAAAAQGGKGDDGLVQRFQLMVFPDRMRTWTNCDRRPNSAARDRAFAAFRAVDALTAESVGAEFEDLGSDGAPFLHFETVAQTRFDEWRIHFENRLLEDDEEPSFESHLAKYRSLVPSLALIFHLADGQVGPIGLASLERAIATTAYLETHARRIYAAAISANVASARALASRILRGSIKDGFTLRDVYVNGWSQLRDAAEVKTAVDELLELGWIVEKRDDQTGGAPKTSYLINPRVLERWGPGTSKTIKRSSTGVRSIVAPPVAAPHASPPPSDHPESRLDDANQRDDLFDNERLPEDPA